MKKLKENLYRAGLIILLNLAVVASMAQGLTLTGTVKDVLGYPMQGVNVAVDNSKLSVITDEYGAFNLRTETSEGKLLFQFPGFMPLEASFDWQHLQHDVVLGNGTGPAQHLVAIGYGHQKSGEVASSMSTVNGQILMRDKSTSLENALTGRLNGILVFPSSFEPGTTDCSILVRGLKTTASNNAPLILIDNVEREFSQLNAEEIEEISILKDAGALAIYGSRGANGVVLVTTKRGNSNQREFTVNSQMSVQESVGRKSYLNALDYALLYNKAKELDGSTTPFYSEEAIEGYRKTVEGAADANPYMYPNNDYQELFLQDYSYQQKHTVTMSGGNNGARYFTSIGYLRQDGLFKYSHENDEYGTNTSYNRANFRTNIDVTINEILSANFDMAGRIELRHYPGASASSIFNAISFNPANAFPVFNPDGSIGGTATYQNNPYGLIARSGYTETNRRTFDATIGFKIDFNRWIPGLTWNTKAGFNFYNLKNRGLSSTFMVYKWNSASDTYTSYGKDSYSTFGSVSTSEGYYSQYFGHSQFDYVRTFDGSHHLSALAFFDLSSRSQPGNVPNFKTVALGARAQYSFEQKYFAELTTTTSACEAFARGNRYGFFPALALAWQLSEEDFMKDVKAIDVLKIRASYGKVGLERPYGTSSSYRFLYMDNWANSGFSGYAFGNPSTSYTGTGEVVAANPLLQWEDSYISNIGLEGSFFQQGLYFSGEYYFNRRSGIWVKRSGWIPSTYGASVPYENAGEAISQGAEFTIGTAHTSKNLSYDVKGMVNYMSSKVIDLQEAPALYDYQYSAGKMINEIWALTSQGFFADKDDVTGSAVSSYGSVQPGDLKYKDVNGDETIDANDKTATGKSEIPQLIYSLNADLQWGNFDFSMLWQGMAKRYLVISPAFELPFYNDNALTSALEAWTPENSTSARYPRLTTTNFSNNSQTSDFWIKDASYLRLRSVELGYSLPATLMNRIGFARARVFMNGYNLLTITGFEYDPECPSAGISQYPAARTYTLGINLSF